MSFFNKTSGGSGSKNVDAGLQPPKNLPDLARDMYEKDSSNITFTSTPQVAPSQEYSKPAAVAEPNRSSVPKLDLSMVRQNLNSSQQSLQNISPAPQPVQQPASPQYSQYSPPMQPSQQMPQPQYSAPVQSPQAQPSYNQNFVHPQMSIINDSTILADGFFKEFEDHIRNNGVDDVALDLMNKNLLDHMVFYHTAKDDSSPFYTSGPELSHAIKIKLEELQNIERNWIINKQKLELLKKFNSSLEYDITMRAEELKRLINESRKKDMPKSNDYLQLIKSRNDNSNSSNNLSNVSLGIIKPAPVQVLPPKNTPPANVSLPAASPSAIASSVSSTVIVPKYQLSKYVTSDPQKFFYARNGKVFKSLGDAINALATMDDDTFSYHVNSSKNDLSRWIAGVFNDYRLSESIKNLISKDRLLEYLNKTIY